MEAKSPALAREFVPFSLAGKVGCSFENHPRAMAEKATETFPVLPPKNKNPRK